MSSPQTLQGGERQSVLLGLVSGPPGSMVQELDGAGNCSARCLEAQLGGCRSGVGAAVTFTAGRWVRLDAARCRC